MNTNHSAVKPADIFQKHADEANQEHLNEDISTKKTIEAIKLEDPVLKGENVEEISIKPDQGDKGDFLDGSKYADEEFKDKKEVAALNSPDPLATPDQQEAEGAILQHPQTATIITINQDHFRNLREEDVRREEEDRRRQAREGFLRKLFSQNMLYLKPNIAVIHSMTTLFMVCLFFFIIMITGARISFKIMIFPYIWDVLTELILIILFSKCTFMVMPYNKYIWIPYSAKALGVVIVGSDLLFEWQGSAYFSFLPMVVFIGLVANKTSYIQIKPTPVCFCFFISLCELLGMIYLGVQKGASYSVLFIILFYYFIISFFFNMIGFMSALLSIFVGIATCFKQFKPKVFCVQFFLGIDNLIAMLPCITFSNWLYYKSAYETLRDAREMAPLNKESEQDFMNFQDLYRKTTEQLKIWSCVLLFYVMVRNCLLFYCTMKPLPQNQQIELRSGMILTMPQRSQAGTTTPAAGGHVPKVQQPNAKDQFLNLFRVNANYYTDLNSQPQPSLNNITRPETAGQSQPKPESEEKQEKEELCTICINEPPNCIIMNCKHGGICKKCALDMMQKNNSCPFCRKSIEKICVVLKLDETQYRVVEEILL